MGDHEYKTRSETATTRGSEVQVSLEVDARVEDGLTEGERAIIDFLIDVAIEHALHADRH